MSLRSVLVFIRWQDNVSHTVDAINLFGVLLLLTLVGLLLSLLLQVLRLLVLFKSLLFLDGLENVVAFDKFGVILPDPLIFQLFIFLTKC